jgi:hypothetical protein
MPARRGGLGLFLFYFYRISSTSIPQLKHSRAGDAQGPIWG